MPIRASKMHGKIKPTRRSAAKCIRPLRDPPAGRHNKDFVTMVFKKAILCTAAALTFMTASMTQARDLLRVGTEPTFAPFEFLDTKTKAFTGYDMDLIRAVADKAGYDVEILNMGFDALLPALMTSSIDVVAAGMSITPERAERVDFTTPYYQTGLSMLVRKADVEKYKTFDDLKGKAIAVQIGTTGADKAKTIEGAKVAAFNTTSEAFMALTAGNAEAVILDRPVIGYFLKNKPKMANSLQMQPALEDAASFGFAVKKGNTALKDKLDAAYQSLVDSGEAKKIYDKWFAQ